MQKAALYTASLIFAAGALFHAVRLITDMEIMVGGIIVPLWGSVPGEIATIALAAWMIVAARRS